MTNEQIEAALATHDRVVEVLSRGDALGRYHFGVFWMADYHPGHPDGEHRKALRGQVFFGNLKDHETKWEEAGMKVLYIRRPQ